MSDDLEHEKTKSFELGHISQLNDTADDLRERAGDLWSEADGRCEIEKARQLKKLAQELEDKATNKREQWDSKYDD